MPIETADAAVDFAFRNTPAAEQIDIGFFGGEPLLEFGLLREITRRVRARADFDAARVKLGMATNGTLLAPEILDFIAENEIQTTISCDGPPVVHDLFRRTADGVGTSARVERGIRMAVERLHYAPVNAVFRPETVEMLPETVDYFSSLGVRHIFFSPDFSANWTRADVERVRPVYARVAEKYKQFYREKRAHYISLLDVKITVLLRGGYQPLEKCGMGSREFAFTADGRVLPCERLAASDPEAHSIGRANGFVQVGPLRDHLARGSEINAACLECTLQPYCSNWCGCSNYMMTGYYNRVSPFLCESERASIEVAFEAFRTLEAELGPTFMDHLGGLAHARSVWDHPAGPARPASN